MKLKKMLNKESKIFTSNTFNDLENISASDININIPQKKYNKDQALKNAIVMLASCNNVNPITEDSGRSLQASSPDEIAFVEFTDNLG